MLENIFQETPQVLAEKFPCLLDIPPKLIHLIRTNNLRWQEVARLICRDPVLLVEISGAVNSSRFNLQVNRGKIEHILAQLGLLKVQKVIKKLF